MAQRTGHQCDPAVCGPTAPEPDRSAPMAVWSCWAMNRAMAAADTGPPPTAALSAEPNSAPAPTVDLSALDRFYRPGGHLTR